jgi:hypothetical protein
MDESLFFSWRGRSTGVPGAGTAPFATAFSASCPAAAMTSFVFVSPINKLVSVSATYSARKRLSQKARKRQ